MRTRVLMLQAFVQGLLKTTEMMWYSRSRIHNIEICCLVLESLVLTSIFSANTYRMRTVTGPTQGAVLKPF
jgi:hypothetical protein